MWKKKLSMFKKTQQQIIPGRRCVFWHFKRGRISTRIKRISAIERPPAIDQLTPSSYQEALIQRVSRRRNFRVTKPNFLNTNEFWINFRKWCVVCERFIVIIPRFNKLIHTKFRFFFQFFSFFHFFHFSMSPISSSVRASGTQKTHHHETIPNTLVGNPSRRPKRRPKSGPFDRPSVLGLRTKSTPNYPRNHRCQRFIRSLRQ